MSPSLLIECRALTGLLAGQIVHRLGDCDAGNYTSVDDHESWEAVIDVCAYVPRHVHQLADILRGRAGRYVQVSSVSAYDPARATVQEDSPLHDDPPAGSEDVPAFYGPLKAACERAAAARFGDVAVVRPAYVCGPYDPEDCFTHWVRRMAEGGDMVVADASAPMQISSSAVQRRPRPAPSTGWDRSRRRRRCWPRSHRRA